MQPDEQSTPRSHYYKRDFSIIEYDLATIYQKLVVRTPIPRKFKPGTYGVVLGSAYSFGPYRQDPYPAQLSRHLDFPILNISTGGNGVQWFDRPDILEYANNAKFVILQLVSARGESSSRFENVKGFKRITLSDSNEELAIHAYFQRLFELNMPQEVYDTAQEMRGNWVMNYTALLQKISAPKVIFWFSKRHPVYQLQTQRIDQVFNHFPQLVNGEMIEKIKQHADFYVECISKKGLPETLLNRFTGMEIKKNEYYPSEAMHELAALKLLPTCCLILGMPVPAWYQEPVDEPINSPIEREDLIVEPTLVDDSNHEPAALPQTDAVTTMEAPPAIPVPVRQMGFIDALSQELASLLRFYKK